jgi:hypothetical protein
MHRPRPWLALLGLLATASPAGPAAAAPPAPAPEPQRPFARGSLDLGLVVAVSAGQEVAFTLGGNFGYFVLPGLEPGLQVDVTFGANRPTVTTLTPYLRWVVWRSYALSPYLKLQGGRWFIEGATDLTALGGGGGLVFFITRSAGLQLEGVVYRLFPGDACPANGCTAPSFGLTVGLYFGGRRPPPARPQPAPPAAAETAPSEPGEEQPDEPGGPRP